jgi:hypothetical protein
VSEPLPLICLASANRHSVPFRPAIASSAPQQQGGTVHRGVPCCTNPGRWATGAFPSISVLTGVDKKASKKAGTSKRRDRQESQGNSRCCCQVVVRLGGFVSLLKSPPCRHSPSRAHFPRAPEWVHPRLFKREVKAWKAGGRPSSHSDISLRDSISSHSSLPTVVISPCLHPTPVAHGTGMGAPPRGLSWIALRLPYGASPSR